MESPNSPANPTALPKPIGPFDLLLSLATVPLVVGLVSTRMLAQFTQELGEWSEEMFRGDRLPLLNFPSHPSSVDTGDPE